MRCALVLAVLVFVCLLPAWALTAEQEAKLVPPDDATTTTSFGGAVAVDGNTALVGAGSQVGTIGPAFVFVRTDAVWTEQARLLADDQEWADAFNFSVALSGDTAVIGAPDGDGNVEGAGAAYVFVRTGVVWTQQAKLPASDGAELDEFGHNVAVDGDTVVIGAPSTDDNGPFSGSAYVFVRVAGVWTQQAKLLPSDGIAPERCGSAVAVDGDTVVLGIPESDGDSGVLTGGAYVFTRVGDVWTEQAKLVPASVSSDSYIGLSVAVDGDTAVIAGRGESVYVFTRTGAVWSEQDPLAPADLQLEAYLGDVDLDGDTLLVAAPNSWFVDPGSAYVFTRTDGEWTEQAQLRSDDGIPGDGFGRTADLDGDTVVVGASVVNAAYVFRLLPDDDVPTTGVVGNALLLLVVLGTGVYLMRRRATG